MDKCRDKDSPADADLEKFFYGMISLILASVLCMQAFASQATYCCRKLHLDEEKVNVNGGAIALGHPLGCTGARCVATLLHEMKKRGKDCRYGVVSMCIGSGMGAAAVFEQSE